MRISLRSITNPYIIFSISWCICLLLYSLHWAQIFPVISTPLLIFLSILIVTFALAGFFFKKIKFHEFTNSTQKLKYKGLLLINTLLFLPNFLYSGIPIISGTRNFEFGIPTLIVLCSTLNSFTCVYCFYIFLISKKRIFLIYSMYCLMFFVLVFARGTIVMTMVTCFFLWINVRKPYLTIFKTLLIGLFILISFYIFGVAGNIRSINQMAMIDPSIDKEYNSNLILRIGDASDSFTDSVIPNEFFWSYVYITSPLSNLQYSVDKSSPPFSLNGLSFIIVDEVLFDSISKRIDDLFNHVRKMPELLVDQLTVPTTFTGSYINAGWIGMAFLALILLILPLIYSMMIMRNPLGIIGMSVICTIYAFSIFDDMLTLTGLSFQIFFPLIVNFFNKWNLNLSANNVVAK